MAKRKQIELPTEGEIEKPKKKQGARNKAKGSEYERKIAKELRDLGFTGVVTSRSESKAMDNNKIDLIDKDNKLPCFIQLKRTQTTPQYFKIREESTVDPEKFVLIWNRQEKANVNFVSVGEVCMIPKSLFYELIKSYAGSSE